MRIFYLPYPAVQVSYNQYIRQGVIMKKFLLCILMVFACTNCAAAFQQPDAFTVAPVNKSIKYPVRGLAEELPIDEHGVDLPIKHLRQETDYAPTGQCNLCWATDISMITNYLGNPRAICQVASMANHDGKSCCRLTMDSPQAEIDLCNKGSDLGTVMDRMGIYNKFVMYPLTEHLIQLEISNGRPVAPYVEIDDIVNGMTVHKYHVVVISGYRKGLYTVLDSARPRAVTMVYDDLLHGVTAKKWKWLGTWYYFSYRVDGCNPRFRQDCDFKK